VSKMLASLSDSTILESLLRHEPKKAFNGWIEEVNLADLVQLICLGGAEQELVIQKAGQKGQIFFLDGEVIHAISSTNQGEQAFFEIMTWQAGTFWLHRGKSPLRTIDAPWNFLLMESLRRLDEGHPSIVPEDEQSLRVLVVDDSKAVRSLLKKIFRKAFNVLEVIEASNVKNALRILESQKPDLITLNVNIPVVGSDPRPTQIMLKSHCPLILVSDFDTNVFSRDMEFLRLGALDLVPRPKAGESWQEAVKRLGHSVNQVREIKINNIRPARVPRSAKIKWRPDVPAIRLVVILGGIGSLLEIPKILPLLSKQKSLAILALLDVANELVPSLANYLDNFSYNTVSALELGGPFLVSQCWIASWECSWKVLANQNGIAILLNTQDMGIDANSLLSSLSSGFGAGLVTLVLSGTDLDIKSGLQAVLSKGGKILLQDPETCLYPAPLRKLLRLKLENRCFNPEKIEDYLDVLNEW